MSNGPEFFQTMMGRKFFEADVPRLLKALERVANALEEANKQQSQEVAEQVAMSAAFLMREACADEAERLWGEKAAAEMRALPLPTEEAQS